MKMSGHMKAQLQKLANGDGVGYHFGTLDALVNRGLAERYKSNHCFGHCNLGYRITDYGLTVVQPAVDIE